MSFFEQKKEKDQKGQKKKKKISCGHPSMCVIPRLSAKEGVGGVCFLSLFGQEI